MNKSQKPPHQTSHEKGVVLYVTLVAMFLFVAFFCYLFNTGRQVDRKAAIQGSADSAAISAASAMARSLNRVAMNNVERSRLIAAIQLIDAMPEAVDYTHQDAVSLQSILQNTTVTPTLGISTFPRDYANVKEDINQQVNILGQMVPLFTRPTIDSYTKYSANGNLWQAFESLHALSVAELNTLPEQIQTTANNAAAANLLSSRESAGGAVPTDFTLDWQQLDFNDFFNPVVKGRLPDSHDDPVIRRGPYDAVFGWRNLIWKTEYVTIPGSGPQPQTTDGFGSLFSGGDPSNGGGPRNVPVSRELVGYNTYGPFRWLEHELTQRVGGHNWKKRGLGRPDWTGPLMNSQFMTRVGRMAETKLNYIWPAVGKRYTLLIPDWETNLDVAKQRAADEGTRNTYSFYIRMRYDRSYNQGSPIPDWTPTDYGNGQHWLLERRNGVLSDIPGSTKIGNHAWQDAAQFTTTTVNADGSENVFVEEIAYIYIWGGVNFGEVAEIQNPNDWTTPPEGPVDLDIVNSFNQPEQTQAGSPWAFFGYALENNDGVSWSKKFTTQNFPFSTAIAQSNVFNNHSFDLWTQMWHSQLVPVSDYSFWVNKVSQSTPPERLSSTSWQNFLTYLSATRELEPLIKH